MMNSEKFNYLEEFIKIHKNYIQPKKGQAVGCTNSEIENLEKNFGFELPLAYKEYLQFMGKDYKGFLVGTNCFITNVIDNNKWLPELLKENNLDFKLPKFYLTFYSHQGYIMAWFELPKIDENPPVWYFHEANTKLPIIEGRFTDFLIKEIEQAVSFSKDMKQ